MLLKTFKNEQMRCCVFDDSKKSIINIVFFNGLLYEQHPKYGIVYALDSYIYNELCELFSKDLKIKAHTYYTYSDFTIICSPDIVQKVLNTVVSFFSNFKIDQNYFKTLLESQFKKTDSCVQSIDDFFYSIDYGFDRLAEPVLGSLNDIKSLSSNDAYDWFKKHYIGSIHYCVIDHRELYYSISELLKLPNIRTKSLGMNKKTARPIVNFYDCDWDVSDIILSFDYCDYSYKNIISAEILCSMIEVGVRDILNKYDVTGDRPVLDIFLNSTRLVFRYSVSQNVLENFLYEILCGLICYRCLSVDELMEAKNNIIEKYRLMFSDITETADFFAWNHSIGDVYDFESLNQLEDTINTIDLSDICTDSLKKDNLSLAICCDEKHEKNIRQLLERVR